MPGFGYSDRPGTTGWGIERIAAAWTELMGRLGYDRFLAHSGDWGAVVTTILGGRFPEQVIGIHTTVAQPPPEIGRASCRERGQAGRAGGAEERGRQHTRAGSEDTP